MIDWLNPSEDILEAKRVGYHEAAREWGEELADLQAEIERLQAKNTEIQANYNDYVNTENKAINRLQAEIARITWTDQPKRNVPAGEAAGKVKKQ